MRRAFTLVEVLIVVIILGIIAAIVIPQITYKSPQAPPDATKLDDTGTYLRYVESPEKGGRTYAGVFVQATPSNPEYALRRLQEHDKRNWTFAGHAAEQGSTKVFVFRLMADDEVNEANQVKADLLGTIKK